MKYTKFVLLIGRYDLSMLYVLWNIIIECYDCISNVAKLAHACAIATVEKERTRVTLLQQPYTRISKIQVWISAMTDLGP